MKPRWTKGHVVHTPRAIQYLRSLESHQKITHNTAAGVCKIGPTLSGFRNASPVTCTHLASVYAEIYFNSDLDHLCRSCQLDVEGKKSTMRSQNIVAISSIHQCTEAFS